MAIILSSTINNNSNALSTNIFTAKEHFIEMFLNKRIKNLNTRKAYYLDIKEFFNVGDIKNISLNDIREVSIFDVEDYINYMIKSGYSSATINRKVASLSTLYNWLLKYQDNTAPISIIKFNPFAAMKEEKPRVNNKITEFLTKEELKLLLDNIDTSKISGIRNKLLVLLIITTAARKSEVLNIKIKDISTYDNYNIIKIIGKGNKLDILKIQGEIKYYIDMYLKKTGRTYDDKESYLFLNHSSNSKNKQDKNLDPSTINKAIIKICKKCGISKRITVHSLRHTAITFAINAGYSIEKVRDFARHSNLSTTNRYIHSINNLKNNPGDKIINLLES